MNSEIEKAIFEKNIEHIFEFNSVSMECLKFKGEIINKNINATIIRSCRCLTKQMWNEKHLNEVYYFIFTKNKLIINDILELENDCIIIDANCSFSLNWINERNSISFLIARNEIFRINEIINTPLSNFPYGKIIRDFISTSYEITGDNLSEIYSIIVFLLKKQVGEKKDKFLEIIEFIDLHYKEQGFNINRVCDEFFLSKRKLQYLFSSNNQTFQNYLADKRILSIKTELSYSKKNGDNLKTIIFNNGYHSYSSTLKAFKKHTGTTMKNYKNMMKK